MQEKLWKVIGFWAMGLILFMATMIVIGWAIDFVRWSGLDSGWAQAIGSIAALGVAIFVMSRQNAHAAKLIVEADKLAVRRRASAVYAIVTRAKMQVGNVREVARRPLPPAEAVHAFARDLNIGKTVISEMRTAVLAIPTYELGSFDMAHAVHQLGELLEAFEKAIAELVKHPNEASVPHVNATLDMIVKLIENVIVQFHRGMAELD